MSASALLNLLSLWLPLEMCVVHMEFPIYQTVCLSLSQQRFHCEYAVLWDLVIIPNKTPFMRDLGITSCMTHMINRYNQCKQYFFFLFLCLAISEFRYIPTAITCKVTWNHRAATLCLAKIIMSWLAKFNPPKMQLARWNMSTNPLSD